MSWVDFFPKINNCAPASDVNFPRRKFSPPKIFPDETFSPAKLFPGESFHRRKFFSGENFSPAKFSPAKFPPAKFRKSLSPFLHPKVKNKQPPRHARSGHCTDLGASRGLWSSLYNLDSLLPVNK